MFIEAIHVGNIVAAGNRTRILQRDDQRRTEESRPTRHQVSMRPTLSGNVIPEYHFMLCGRCHFCIALRQDLPPSERARGGISRPGN